MPSLIKKTLRYSRDPGAGFVRLVSKISEIAARARYRLLRRNTGLRVWPVIWIRTPKCASSSILVALEAADAVLDWNRDRTITVDSNELSRKVICVGADNKDEFLLKYPGIWHSAFRWSVVRNPYDKTVSAWKYLENLRERSLRDVLESPPQKGESFSDYYHFTRTFEDMLSIDGELVVQKVIRYEELTSGLTEVFDHIGVPFRGIPKTNVTPKKKKDSSEYLEEDTRALIRRLFRDDFQKFGYPF